MWLHLNSLGTSRPQVLAASVLYPAAANQAYFVGTDKEYTVYALGHTLPPVP